MEAAELSTLSTGSPARGVLFVQAEPLARLVLDTSCLGAGVTPETMASTPRAACSWIPVPASWAGWARVLSGEISAA